MTEEKPSDYVTEKVKNEKIVSQQICEQRRSLSLRGFLVLKTNKVTNDSISALGSQKALKVLKLGKDTEISSLENLPAQQNLVEILANSTKLESYKGISKLKSVSIFSIKDTPMANRPNYRLALLLAFGPRIREINGEKISNKERQHASKYPSICKTLVDKDWDPTDEAPTREETLELIEKYLPKKAEMIQKNKNKDKIIEKVTTPRKSITAMKETKKYQYNKCENDEELVNSLIEKLAEYSIFVENGENAKDDLLRIINELTLMTATITDEVNFGEDAEENEVVDDNDRTEIQFDDGDKVDEDDE